MKRALYQVYAPLPFTLLLLLRLPLELAHVSEKCCLIKLLQLDTAYTDTDVIYGALNHEARDAFKLFNNSSNNFPPHLSYVSTLPVITDRCSLLLPRAPRVLLGCKNRRTPFPGQMS